MFGHDNQHHDDNTAPAPAPDASLADGLTMPAPPAPDDDINGGYIASDMPTSTPAATAPQVANDTMSTASTVTPATPAPATPAADVPADDLLQIKQHALQQLSPLVGHLDQTPEEKFRTTMMMIQASDNPHLIPQAYEAAQAITDEKVRAQSLLDIVNEINYFTQHHDQQAQ